MSVLSIYDEQGNEIPIPSIKGKSAYEYAKDGGYTGTEAEFAKELAGTVESATLSTDYIDGKITFYKKSGIVSMFVNGLKGLTVSTNNTVGYIPVGFRPCGTLRYETSDISGNQYRFQLNADGEIRVYPYTTVSSQTNLVDTFTYVSA